MASYIVEFGNNKFVKTTFKDALKKAYALAKGISYPIEIWQMTGEKIRHIGTVIFCEPTEKGRKGKLRPVMFYFELKGHVRDVSDIYPLKSDGTLMTKVDILDIRWYYHLNHIYWYNDKLPKSTAREYAMRDAYIDHRRNR